MVIMFILDGYYVYIDRFILCLYWDLLNYILSNISAYVSFISAYVIIFGLDGYIDVFIISLTDLFYLRKSIVLKPLQYNIVFIYDVDYDAVTFIESYSPQIIEKISEKHVSVEVSTLLYDRDLLYLSRV